MNKLTFPEPRKFPQQSSLSAFLGGLGESLSTGAAESSKLRQALALEQQKQQAKEQQMQKALALYQQLSGSGVTPPEQRDVGFEQTMESQAAPEDFPASEAVAAMSLIDPNLGKVMAAERKEGLRRTATDKKLAFDETRDIRKEFASKSRKAKDFDLRLDRMDKLIGEGKLINPIYNAMLEKFGFDIPALKNPQSQEFDKLVSDLTRDIRARFGARITNFELKIFLKSIPGLSQTDAGKKRVVYNLRLLNQADIVRNKAKTEAIRRNRGTPPINLEDQVEEIASPELDRITEEFRQGVEGPTGAPAQKGPQFTAGQTFTTLPPNAPEGAIVTKGNQTFVFRRGKWRKK